MKASNTLNPKGKEKKSFSAVISMDASQQLIRKSLRDEAAVRRFTGTMISVVNSNEQLKNCDAGSIISAALRGEGAGLIYGHGYYVVPYGTKATYITSYKGYINLALATGRYADIDCVDVREGERRGRDPRTGKPVVDMSVYDSDEEREKHPIIGVKAYFLLKDGYYREEYWTRSALLDHADRYSKAFSRELYEKWQRGEELTKDEAYKVANGSPWYTSTLAMMKKTALRSLLNSGYAPLSNEVKSLLNSEAESGEGDAIDLDLFDTEAEEPTVETEAEVVDAEITEEGNEEAPIPEVIPDAAPAPAPRRGRPRKGGVDVHMDEDDDAIASFFGE